MRNVFIAASVATLALVAAVATVWPPVFWSLLVIAPLILRGVADMVQTRQAVRRNFPVIGHGRYLLEQIRPEINQYFVESNNDGRPFSRNDRSVVYQRAKGELDTLPFGTQRDVYAAGYEWINHSLVPVEADHTAARVVVGGSACTQPYSASIFNVSAMSYGSLSRNAVLALNAGAKIGGFAHNTGEGGLSPHHLEPGGDLVWQIGTGYFSCRTPDGHFNPEAFAERAALPAVRMIEVKLSQGAKPGHGGILPAAKLTPEIVAIRGVVPGQDVICRRRTPPSPDGLPEFLQTLRRSRAASPWASLCIGKRHEFFGIVKAMPVGDPSRLHHRGRRRGVPGRAARVLDSVGTFNDGSASRTTRCRRGLRDEIRPIASGSRTPASRSRPRSRSARTCATRRAR
jgi:glutamate synthase domain-containing protein 2